MPAILMVMETLPTYYRYELIVCIAISSTAICPTLTHFFGYCSYGYRFGSQMLDSWFIGCNWALLFVRLSLINFLPGEVFKLWFWQANIVVIHLFDTVHLWRKGKWFWHSRTPFPKSPINRKKVLSTSWQGYRRASAVYSFSCAYPVTLTNKKQMAQTLLHKHHLYAAVYWAKNLYVAWVEYHWESPLHALFSLTLTDHIAQILFTAENIRFQYIPRTNSNVWQTQSHFVTAGGNGPCSLRAPLLVHQKITTAFSVVWAVSPALPLV